MLRRLTRVALTGIVFAALIRADRAADVRAQISRIATALTNGNASDAMTPFDKSCPNYDKLSGYFQGLNAFQLNNEVDVLDEQDTETETKLLVGWTLTLTDLTTDAIERRTAEITIRLVRKDGKWRIVSFAPIGIFNPQQKREDKR